MTQKRNMVIHFMDGTEVSYYFPRQVDASPATVNTATVSKIKKIMENPYLIVEADGAVNCYPTNNIKSIRLYPAPDTLPDFVITGAELV